MTHRVPAFMLRKANVRDITHMQSLINFFAGKDLMLPKSLNELYENIRDFWVVTEHGKFAACAALHVCWDDLAEIKSVAVAGGRQGKGIGKSLVHACIEEARHLGIKRLFVLTYQPDYFRKFGFRRIKHAGLPHKIWAECINCCKFPNCQEIALLKQL